MDMTLGFTQSVDIPQLAVVSAIELLPGRKDLELRNGKAPLFEMH